VRVPFLGTPLKGIQVLGLLETRCLKFKQVYILDVNEGILPGVGRNESLLPAAIRRHLGLPTWKDHEKLQSDDFHALVEGADEVHLFFSEWKDSEKSRLAEELIWREQREKGDLQIDNLHQVHFIADFTQTGPREVPKTDPVVDFLHHHLRYSASSLDEYLACPLRFYYHRVLKLEPKERSAEMLEAGRRGDLIHAILRDFFSRSIDRPLKFGPDDFMEMRQLIDKAFRDRYGEILPGGIHLVRRQVATRMEDLLHYQQREPCAGDRVLECELTIDASLELDSGLVLKAGGRLDRVDRRQARYRILDYKTGSSAAVPKFKSFHGSDREQWPRTLKSVQLPFYVLLFLAYRPRLQLAEVDSALLMLGGKIIKEEALWKEQEDREEVMRAYRHGITVLAGEIRNPQMPFVPTPRPRENCPGCDYRVMCGQQWLVGNR